MVGHGFIPGHAADVVRWHIVAMLAPSFFTGSVIVRFGRLPVIAVGLLLLSVCGVIALAGADLQHFYLALIALGLVAVGSFGSGALLDAYGWSAVQYAMTPALVAVLAGIAWLALSRRAP